MLEVLQAALHDRLVLRLVLGGWEGAAAARLEARLSGCWFLRGLVLDKIGEATLGGATAVGVLPVLKHLAAGELQSRGQGLRREKRKKRGERRRGQTQTAFNTYQEWKQKVSMLNQLENKNWTLQ